MKPISSFDHKDPAKIVIMLDQLQISRGKLQADIASLVSWLSCQGVVAGQSVAIFLKNPYWSWVCRLAALRMGLAQVTLAARSFQEQVAATGLLDVALGDFNEVEGADVARRVIVCSPRTMGPFSEQFAVSITDGGGFDPQREATASYLILTSGTTGKPKIVALSARILAARLAILQKMQGINEKTVLLSTAGHNTMPGLGYSLATWQAGGCVVFTGSRENVQNLPANLLVTTPVELHELLSRYSGPWAGCESRQIIVAGGRLPVSVRAEALSRACCQIVIDYGATETNCTATGNAMLLDRHPGAVGFVVEGSSVEIVDHQGCHLPAGKEGLVRTRTPYMVLAYGAAHEVKVDEIFRDGWFYPGDLGILFDDGLLAITGRLTETLNIGGTKIPLLDFEAALEDFPGLQDACAIILKLEEADRLAFLVVCDDRVDLQALTQHVTRRLPFQIQFNLLRVLNIPRNAMGKIPRNALSHAYSEIYQSHIKTRQ